jgi:eukaryotic-like serine/threonine-protein kinase
MSAPSIPEFLSLLSDRRLLEPEQLEEISRDLVTNCEDSTKLAPKLVERGLLTPFQAELILSGRGQELVLGHYRLLALLGEGGMGQVYKALDQRLNRPVALKVIRPERLTQNPEVIRRFHREARAAAQLHHPNIVIIFDFDQANDTHFIAMEYVEGIDLARLVKEAGPLPVANACNFIRQAALGLQHAHEQKMVHRDIKPSNLLVMVPKTAKSAFGLSPGSALSGSGASSEGAAPANQWLSPTAVVKVLDMGLARLTETKENDPSFSSLTHEGSVIGTPDYIAPEQARNSHLADIRSDLYSLGATFYYLLTGQPPFPEGTAVEKLLMHQLDDPRPVEELRPDVPSAVAMVLRKLMAKAPLHRYQEPAAAAEALNLLGAVSAPSSSLKPPPDVGQKTGSTDVVEIAPLAKPSGSGPSSAFSPHAPTLIQPPPASKTPLVPSSAPVVESKRSVAAPGTPTDLESPKLLEVFKGHRGWVMAVSFSSDRHKLASCGVDGTVRIRNFSKTRRKELVLPHQGAIHSVAFAPDNKTLAAGSGALDGSVFLWDLSGAEPEPKALLRGHSAPVEALAFSTDGKLLASAGTDRIVRVWDMTVKGAEERAALKGHTDTIKTLAFSPDGKMLASAGQDETVRLWSVGRIWTEELAILRAPVGHVLSLAFSPDGQTLASGSLDQVVRLWDLGGKQSADRSVIKLQEHPGVVRLVLFTPDGKSLVSVGSGGQAIQWDVASARKIRKWMMPSSQTMVCSVALTIDGRYLAAGTSEGTVTVYRLATREPEEAKT